MKTLQRSKTIDVQIGLSDLFRRNQSVMTLNVDHNTLRGIFKSEERDHVVGDELSPNGMTY